MKNCENCNKEDKGEYGSGRFCSEKCSRSFSTKSKRKEINEKISKTLTKEPYKLICKECRKEFENKRKRKFCSNRCSNLYRGGWLTVHNKINKDEWSKINRNSYRLGKK